MCHAVLCTQETKRKACRITKYCTNERLLCTYRVMRMQGASAMAARASLRYTVDFHRKDDKVNSIFAERDRIAA